MATAAAWGSIFAGLVLGLASKSIVVRVGGAFIASLVVILVVVMIVRDDDPRTSEPTGGAEDLSQEAGATLQHRDNAARIGPPARPKCDSAVANRP